MHEEKRELKYRTGKFGMIVLDPQGCFHLYWDLILLFFLLYIGFAVPYQLSFLHGQISTHFYLDVFENIMDIVFFIDILVNFITSHNDPVRHFQVKDPKRIATFYLKGWFFVDFLAILPIYSIQIFLRKQLSLKG